MKGFIDFVYASLLFVLCFSIGYLSCSSKNDVPEPEGEEDTLISENYPNDNGIEHDPDVLFVEKFEGELEDIVKRYSDSKNVQHMSLPDDAPPGSAGGKSIRISNNNGETDGGHLYNKFDPGFDDTVYLRYYVKYPEASRNNFHHISVRIGGYDPPSAWPMGRAGRCNVPTSFNLSYEPITGSDGKMETYIYWPEMRASNAAGDQCYGNYLITNNGRAKTLEFDRWMCVELMIKLNTPDERDGEFRVWQDGEEIGYWKPGSPKGGWNGGRFSHSSGGTPFTGFLWRGKSNPNLRVNNVKFEFYDTRSPKGHHNYVQYSHVVIAKKRIGPIKQ